MPLWDDPLDELIAGLESALAVVPRPPQSLLPTLEDLQAAVNPLLFASPGDAVEPVALTAEQEAKLRRVGEQMAATLARSREPSGKQI
jgi:hypothetical protein